MTNDELASSLDLSVEYWLDWGREFAKMGPFDSYEEAMNEANEEMNLGGMYWHLTFSIEKRYRKSIS